MPVLVETENVWVSSNDFPPPTVGTTLNPVYSLICSFFFRIHCNIILLLIDIRLKFVILPNSITDLMWIADIYKTALLQVSLVACRMTLKYSLNLDWGDLRSESRETVQSSSSCRAIDKPATCSVLSVGHFALWLSKGGIPLYSQSQVTVCSPEICAFKVLQLQLTSVYKHTK
jgi:hypothetical protein